MVETTSGGASRPVGCVDFWYANAHDLLIHECSTNVTGRYCLAPHRGFDRGRSRAQHVANSRQFRSPLPLRGRPYGEQKRKYGGADLDNYSCSLQTLVQYHTIYSTIRTWFRLSFQAAHHCNTNVWWWQECIGDFRKLCCLANTDEKTKNPN